jgi:hypothetical protein
MQHLPDGLPRLAVGRHTSPAEGACFMEYASVLAGEPWSDQPACTHPVLAELARMVNDTASPAGRSRLVVLVPSVVGLVGDDPRISALLVDRAVTVAGEHGVRSRSLRLHQRRARIRLSRLEGRRRKRGWAGRLQTLGDNAYQWGPAMCAVVAVVDAVGRRPARARDEALLALLTGAIDAFPREAARTAVRAADGAGFSGRQPETRVPVGV